MARRLDDKPFKMSNNSFLNNIPVEDYADMPRAHDKEGNARFDLFCFILKDSTDKNKFHEGQVVELFT